MRTLLFFALFISLSGIAQDSNWLAMPETRNEDSVSTIISEQLNFNAGNGSVVIVGGEKLQKLDEFVRKGETSVEGVKMDGFRVLIFFDQDKSASESQKARFLSMYPEHKAYVDYLAPNYRVRVGNFKTKLEAEALKAELISTFPTSIVIADKIQLIPLPSVETVGVMEEGQR